MSYLVDIIAIKPKNDEELVPCIVISGFHTASSFRDLKGKELSKFIKKVYKLIEKGKKGKSIGYSQLQDEVFYTQSKRALIDEAPCDDVVYIDNGKLEYLEYKRKRLEYENLDEFFKKYKEGIKDYLESYK